jgi:mono/diheme cytochrome c family protein
MHASEKITWRRRMPVLVFCESLAKVGASLPRAMPPFVTPFRSSLAVLLIAGAVVTARAAQPAPGAPARVDFAREIQPIFEASCVQCHARGKEKGGFSLETREDFLDGGENGAAAVVGQSAKSAVMDLITTTDAEKVMPKKGKKLTPQQVAAFRAWIDQGMVWPKEINFFKHEPANLRSRELADLKVPTPAANPIDGFIAASFAKQGVVWPKVVEDRVYARRVWLDTIGLLPPPAELEAFVADPAADKRARLVARLLEDRQAYAEHWLTFWNDLLRNDYKGTGYIDGGRKPITSWLYTALARNVPYDRFVAQLINPGAEAEGFANGILWRGAVNASMVPPMQAAQSVAQVFLGVNLKCASCHDSFINEYTLKDAYGLASVYSDGPIEIAECDKPTGHMGQVKFLYGELGMIDGKADPATRKQQLAEIITGRSNGRLPRTIVNRLWQRFMGYGLVEPVDEMDKPAWSPELMDWLAEDLVAHRYDLKHTMARILTSRAYQLPAVNVGEVEEHYVFRGPGVRRLSAEQFSDAIMALSGSNYGKTDAKLNRRVALHGAEGAKLPLAPKWIWNAPGASAKAKPAAAVFKREVTLAELPTEAFLTVAADNAFSISINDQQVGASSKRTSAGPDIYDIRAKLKLGANTIRVMATNLGPDGATPIPPAKLGPDGKALPFDPKAPQLEFPPSADNPAGLILYARVRGATEVMDFVSDCAWTTEVGDVVELGGVALAPWKLGESFLELAASVPETEPVARASLIAADPLMAALGRPNREQVVTVRQGTATTLQALELTNGATLAKQLQAGADKICAGALTEADDLVTKLYGQALSRPPTAGEKAAALAVVGSPVKAEGVQDLLWALAMLPEFQLIF